MSQKLKKMPEMSLFSKKKTNNFLLDHMIELLLVVIIIVLAIAEPAFLTPSNLLNVLRNSAMKGVIAYGMCLVMIAGEIDLSVGSQVALSAVIVAWISKTLNDVAGIPLALGAVIGVVAAVAVGMLLGVFHAWSRHKFGMPSFIVTLATAYLNRIRIDRSKELLRQKNIRLTDIAQLVGFEDQSYFTKVFKKQEGVPPLRYRESHTKDMKARGQEPQQKRQSFSRRT